MHTPACPRLGIIAVRVVFLRRSGPWQTRICGKFDPCRGRQWHRRLPSRTCSAAAAGIPSSPGAAHLVTSHRPTLEVVQLPTVTVASSRGPHGFAGLIACVCHRTASRPDPGRTSPASPKPLSREALTTNGSPIRTGGLRTAVDGKPVERHRLCPSARGQMCAPPHHDRAVQPHLASAYATHSPSGPVPRRHMSAKKDESFGKELG